MNERTKVDLCRFDLFSSYLAFCGALDRRGLYSRASDSRLFPSADLGDLQSAQCPSDLSVHLDRFLSLARLLLRHVRREHRRETSSAGV